MSLLRFVLPAVAVAGGAAAASCSVSGTTTISDAAQATSIAACTTFSGSIAMATGITGDVSFDGELTHITGDLVGNSVGNITSLSASNLVRVAGDFIVNSAASLQTLSFSSMTGADSLQLIALGSSLTQVNFAAEGLQQVNSLVISDTSLQSLQGINLATAQNITITENLFLTDINMQLHNVTGDLTLSQNGVMGVSVTAAFPDLESAGAVIIGNCTSLDLSSLKNVTQGFTLQDNTFTTFTAPNLTSVQAFTVTGNSMMKNMTFPALQTISGAMLITNNTAYLAPLAFPKLTTIGGSAGMLGNFTSVSFPDLNRQQGIFDLYSYGNINCNGLDTLHSDGNIGAGGYHCVPKYQSAATSTVALPSGASASAAATSSGAAAHLDMSMTQVGLTGMVAALFGLLM